MKKRRDPLLWAGGAFLVMLLLLAIFYPILGPDPLKTGGTLFAKAGEGHGPLGTDYLGRDILSRIAYGTRISLFIGVVVQSISLVFGILMGTLGVFAPRTIRIAVMRFTDGMFAFPDILLAMLIISILSAGVLPVIVALSITAWPSVARLVATQLASLKDREFVVAARAAGASTTYVVTRHVLPQLWGILLAVTMIDMAGTILAESTLSFLGIGVQDPMPTWGNMIDRARDHINSEHWIVLLWPCLFLSATIFALNFVGDGLRAKFDPKNTA